MLSADSSIFTMNARVFQVFKKYSEKIFEGENIRVFGFGELLFIVSMFRETRNNNPRKSIRAIKRIPARMDVDFAVISDSRKRRKGAIACVIAEACSLSLAGRRVDWEFVDRILSLQRSRSVAAQLSTWRHPTPYRRHRGLGASSLLRRDPCIKGSHLIRPGLHSIRRVRATTTRDPAAK